MTKYGAWHHFLITDHLPVSAAIKSSPDSSIIVYILGLFAELLHPFHGKGGALETIHFQPVQRNVQIFRNAVTVRQQKHTYRYSIPLSFKPDANLLPLQLCESAGIIYSFAYLHPKNASCCVCSSCNGG
jgi:hypothetical protein